MLQPIISIATLAVCLVIGSCSQTERAPHGARNEQHAPTPRHGQSAETKQKEYSWPQQREQFRREKEAFICAQAQLTPEEAECFFTTHNDLRRLQREANRKMRMLFERVEREQLSEYECQRILETLQTLRASLEKAENECITTLQGQLPARKLLRAIQAEQDFGRKMFRQMMETDKDHQKPRHNPEQPSQEH